jgi:hypothetical protein
LEWIVYLLRVYRLARQVLYYLTHSASPRSIFFTKYKNKTKTLAGMVSMPLILALRRLRLEDRQIV